MEEKKVGIITIRDFIGDCNTFLGMFLIDIIKQFKSQPEATTFKVYINSKGGDILEAFKIKDYFTSLIEEKGFVLMTIGEEIVASSATIIHQAGSEGMRFLKPECRFMIHSPSGGVEGNTKAIAEYSEMMLQVDDLMAETYAESFDLPKALVSELMAIETYLTAQDCEDLGIAQIYNETPIVARANF